MDMTGWAYALQLSNASIDQAIAHLQDLGASPADLQDLVRILRISGWDFADTLADALGLPVLALPIMPSPALSQADRAQYDNLAAGSHLFGTGRLTRVRRDEVPHGLEFEDVAMDGIEAIVCTRPEMALGTAGLGPCIAVCARGINPQGQAVIGLWHASYDEDQSRLRNNLRDGLDKLTRKMTRRGAVQVEFSLAGGMKQPNARCIEFGQMFLSLESDYNIVAAEIHHCESEDQATDVVMTAGGTYHGVQIYDPPALSD
jgi:hypothetical protein